MVTYLIVGWFALGIPAAIVAYGITFHYFSDKYTMLPAEYNRPIAGVQAFFSLICWPCVFVPVLCAQGPHFGWRLR